MHWRRKCIDPMSESATTQAPTNGVFWPRHNSIAMLSSMPLSMHVLVEYAASVDAGPGRIRSLLRHAFRHDCSVDTTAKLLAAYTE